ncbi:hypothetical protein Tco_1240154, partial [Tanacetum coccineum]
MFVKGLPYVNAPAGRPLGAYDLEVATPRALVYVGLMTSGDARSWYMISGDAKSWRVKSMISKVVMPLRRHWDLIFGLETIKDVTVAQKLSYDILSSSFRRAPRGGLEEFQYLQLSKEIEEVSLIDTEDRWSWYLDGQGVFSVASVR